MYPPGYTNSEPYFNRDEAESLMGGVINHFSSLLDDYMTI